MKAYTVAHGTSLNELEGMVNGLLEQGYLPQGGVCVHHDKRAYYHQAMCRPSSPELPQPSFATLVGEGMCHALGQGDERARCEKLANDEADAWAKEAARFNSNDPLRQQGKTAARAVKNMAAAIRVPAQGDK